MWQEAVDAGFIDPSQYYTYNDKKFGTTKFTTAEIFKIAKYAETQINSPIINPGRYARIVRKFIKQKRWDVIKENIIRLPSIIKNILIEHPYEVVPEELHG
jgi:hypothetical protein